jgi:uncharacterized membrane protein HdeD (DUF308 family)
MFTLVTRNWWVIAIRGVAAIAFGVLAIAWPQLTIVTLVFLFGAYALIDGVSSLIAVIRGDPQTRGRGLWFALIGVVGILVGIYAFVFPGLTTIALLYVVAAWAIVTGILQVLAAIWLRREIEGEWLLALGGILSVVFGLLLVIAPGAGIMSLLFVVAIWAIIFGVSLLGLALRMRSLHQSRPRSDTRIGSF